MNDKPAARGTIHLTLARFCFMASGYVISVVLARGLGPAAYGVYGVVMSLLLWIEMVSSAGLKGAIGQMLPENVPRAAALEGTMTGLLIIVSFVLLALCWAFAAPVADLFDIPEGAGLLRIATLDLPFNGLYLAFQGVLFAHKRFAVLSMGMVIYALTKVTGMVLLLVVGLSVQSALIVNVLATVGALAYLMRKSPLRGWWPDREFVRPMVRLGIVMGAYVIILQVLLSLDLWFLQGLWTGSPETIGFYVAALNIARLPSVVPSVLTGVLFTSLAWALAQKNEDLARRYLHGAMRFTSVVLVPSGVLAIVFAEPIMALLYSDAYRPGGVYLKLQILGFIAMAYLDLLIATLMARRRHAVAVSILASLLPLSIAANLILIPRFGAMGAAYSLLLTIGSGAIVAAVFAYREFGSLASKATVARVLLASGCMGIVAHFVSVPQSLLLVELAGLGLVYGLCLLVTKEIRIDELRSLASLKGSS